MHSGRLKVLIPAGVERQFNVENNARALDQCWNDLCTLIITPTDSDFVNEKEKKKNPNKQIGESFNMVLDETGCKWKYQLDMPLTFCI
jgi:hypothetical protein